MFSVEYECDRLVPRDPQPGTRHPACRYPSRHIPYFKAAFSCPSRHAGTCWDIGIGLVFWLSMVITWESMPGFFYCCFFPHESGARLPDQHSLGELGWVGGGYSSWMQVHVSISCSSGDAAEIQLKTKQAKSARCAPRQCQPWEPSLFLQDCCMPGL